MAAELQTRADTTGTTVRATISKALTVGGKIQKCIVGTGAFEDMTVANWATYLITMTETPASSYWYVGTWPAGLTAVGWYYVNIYAGTAISSTLIGTQFGYWDGTNYHLDGANVEEWKGATAPAMTGDAFARLGAPAGASISADIAALNTAVVAGVAVALQATANTETTGTLIGGTYESTDLSNGVYWILAPVTPAVAEVGTAGSPFGLNVSLTFGASATQYINSVTIRGYYRNATGSSRYCNVYAYNYVSNAWDQLSDSVTRMNHATTNQNYTYTLLSAHKKADGEIKIGFKSPSTTTGDRLNVDQCVVNVQTAGPSSSDIADAVWLKTAALQYGNGVWIDTVNGTAGTSVTVGNGTSTKPCLTYADALVVADTLGLKRFYLKPGTLLTGDNKLTQSHANWQFIGAGEIDLNGQSIASAVFEDVYEIIGTSTGEEVQFYRCGISTVTAYHSYYWDCIMRGTLTMAASVENEFYFFHCSDASGFGNSSEFVYGEDVSAYFRGWSGGIKLSSHLADSETIIDGAGRLLISDTSQGGDIVLRGNFSAVAAEEAGLHTVAQFEAHGGTFTQTARYATDQAMADTSGTTTMLARVPQVITMTQIGGTGAYYVQALNSNGDVIGTSTYAGGAIAGITGVTFPSSVASPTNITAASGVSLAASQHVIVDSGTVTDVTNPVTLANGAHGGAAATITLQTPIAATVPDNQKVDVNTIKTKSVTVDSGGTTFPAAVGTSTLVVGAKMDVADSLNATGVADLKTKLGTIPASGDWNTIAPPSVIDIREEIDDNSTQLETLVAAIGSLSVAERNSIADALLDRSGAIDAKTPRQAIRIVAAILAGKIADAGTGTETFKGLDGVTTRAVVTVDNMGNRSAVTYP